MKEEKRMVVLEERSLIYTLQRKKVKNINMRVRPDGEIVVSAGSRVPVTYIDRLIREKKEFFYGALEGVRKRQELQEQQKKSYVSGESFLLLGREIPLEVRSADRNAGEEEVHFTGDCLYLYVAEPGDFRRKEKLMIGWMQDYRRQIFQSLIQEVYERFRAYQVPYPQVRVRSMTSRWGSCQPLKGKISLNSRLIHAPMEQIEYVIVHEFAHFIQANHSREFWKVVEEFVPEWKRIRRELNESGI